ncbi:hypothetical protein AMTRI_Chr10g229740 [Amborella trichopoda]
MERFQNAIKITHKFQIFSLQKFPIIKDEFYPPIAQNRASFIFFGPDLPIFQQVMFTQWTNSYYTMDSGPLGLGLGSGARPSRHTRLRKLYRRQSLFEKADPTFARSILQASMGPYNLSLPFLKSHHTLRLCPFQKALPSNSSLLDPSS